MRTLVIGALALILVGCSCALSPQASMEACMDANGLACFDRAAASRPVELNPASVNANSATTPVKSTMATKAEKPSSADARTKDHRTKDHLATKAAKSAVTVAKVEPPASGPPAGNAAASSSTTAASMASSPLKSGRSPSLQWPPGRSRRRNRKRIIPIVLVLRKLRCLIMPKRPHQRQTTAIVWLPSSWRTRKSSRWPI